MADPAAMLRARTAAAWFELAVQRTDELLLDHANCEKKAASTALALMFAYPEDFELAEPHVAARARGAAAFRAGAAEAHGAAASAFRRLSPSRYAEGLRRALRRDEPGRRVDLLLCGALIEARSHERFMGLIERLPAPLAEFYASLAAAESRHAGLYLRLAARGGVAVEARLGELAAVEAELATAPDPEFRFHSGTPV